MSKQTAIAYIGTYTKENSEGIYRLTIDKQTGEVLENQLAVKTKNPTYLKISEDQQYIYSVVKNEDQGGLAAFKVNSDGTLAFLNRQTQKGAPPCHVSASLDDQVVVSANYHLGTIMSYSTEQGQLSKPISEIKHIGNSIHERQDKAHAHFSGFTPDQKFVLTCDLGTDQITTYLSQKGKLSKVSDLTVAAGSGPRHLVFHPNTSYVYIMTELTAEVIVAKYNKENGSLEVVQTVPSLPTAFTEPNKGSAIHISNDGRFLYVSNRGQDAIVTFKVEEATGQLTYLATTPVEGESPRDFNLDPSGNILVAANEFSHTITIFSVNKQDGTLTLLQKGIKVPEPVCVKFIQ